MALFVVQPYTVTSFVRQIKYLKTILSLCGNADFSAGYLQKSRVSFVGLGIHHLQ